MNKKIFFAFLLFASSQLASLTDVTIFIHGTLFSGLVALKPFTTQQKFDETYRLVRSSPLVQEHQVILEKGMQEVSHEALQSFYSNTVDSERARLATYNFVPAYAKINQVYNPHEKHAYYTFGWSGVLDCGARELAGENLYRSLVELREKYDNEVKFHVVCHSHGGNVALYLVLHEAKYKKHLSIETLSLYGTPLQPETAQCIPSPLFKSVFNFYSASDRIQILDKISVKSGICHRTFAEAIPAIKNCTNRYDIALKHNEKSTPFGHAHLFVLGHSPKIIKALDPLPLAVLNPAFITELEKIASEEYDSFTLSLNEKNDQLDFVLTNNSINHRSPQLTDLCTSLSTLTKHQWNPTTTFGVFPIISLFSKATKKLLF